jgi:MFS family permease
LVYHSTVAEVAGSLILFAVGGAFVTLAANVIIFFTPRESTGVVSATFSTMRIIGGAIGPVIAGVFISLYVAEVLLMMEEQQLFQTKWHLTQSF